MTPQQPALDVLSVGELLVDLISVDFADSLDDVQDFRRIPGGSPANLAGNLARLGRKIGLAATVGNDDMGDFLKQYVEDLGVQTSCLRQVPSPTTLILLTRSQGVSNFQPYRQADFQITQEQLAGIDLKTVKIFHTTCFGLSKEPAQTSILEAAREVCSQGGQASIDANYASKIWSDREEARSILAAYCSLGAIVKFSEVDWQRLYGAPLVDPAQATDFLHGLGARIACITLGDKGCFVSDTGGSHFLPARPVEVRDTTGAGDAFWSGFLCAVLDGENSLNCAKAGRKMAERKLAHFGPLPGKVLPADIYVDF